MVIVTHESYDSVLVGTEKNRKVSSHCLKTASDGADATRRGRSCQIILDDMKYNDACIVLGLPIVFTRGGMN